MTLFLFLILSFLFILTILLSNKFLKLLYLSISARSETSSINKSIFFALAILFFF